jgi:hypothetical protein
MLLERKRSDVSSVRENVGTVKREANSTESITATFKHRDKPMYCQLKIK